jgi:hypothetical protein
LTLKNQGKHFIDEGKELISAGPHSGGSLHPPCGDALSNRMNRKRLSTVTTQSSTNDIQSPPQLQLREFYTPGLASPPRVTYIIYIKRIKIYIYSLNARGGPGGGRVLNLLAASSNYEIQSDGKILIKSSGEYLKGRGSISIEVLDDKGLIVNNFNSSVLYFLVLVLGL